ncbi:MAG: GGDEF domain-containing protein [Desulfuromonadales bacterium]|nr:GGDEF domain-containing protein [Desulfuromonadales bacterium]
MDLFQWDKTFETGIAAVDQQHQHLVTVINQFGDLITHNRVDNIAIEAVFDELTRYAQYHFTTEENVMVSVGVDPRLLATQEEEHQTFLQEVTLMHQSMHKGEMHAEKQLFEYLVNWLIYHILGSDMSMAKQIKAIRQKVKAPDAYLAEKKGVDQSKGLLLTALNNLFLQVSNRNRELRGLNQTLEERVEARTKDLLKANQKLDELASTDALTGLANRRHSMLMLERLWLESSQMQTPLACMMIDADGFKAVNDTYGHDAGDTVLCELAKELTFAVRTDDIVCRLGGDEFLIILPNTDIEGALKIAHQTHAQVAEIVVPVTGGVWKGSISVGVAERSESMQSIKGLIKAADTGVYAAKNAGKNCVKAADG